MANIGAIKDRDFSSFVESPSRGAPSAAREVFVGNKVEILGDIGLVQGIEYDDIQASYPDSSTENYSYYLQNELVAIIEVTYTNSSKNIFLRARRI